MTGRDRFRDQLDPLWSSRRRARLIRQGQRDGEVLVNRYVRPGAAFEHHVSVTLRDFSACHCGHPQCCECMARRGVMPSPY